MKITDEELIDLLVARTLEVDLATAEVSCRGRLLKPSLAGDGSKPETRLRMSIRYRGLQRRILRSRLVYMAGTLQVIPEGYELHHVDGDRYHDAFHNLILLTVEDHLKIHGKFSYSLRSYERVPF